MHCERYVQKEKQRCAKAQRCFCWAGRIRTDGWRSQSPLPYRLATAQKKKRPCGTGPTRSLVGCLERFELSASRATIWRANQLRHRHHEMRPKGLEPLAHCLEGSCSIHLSYGRTWFFPTGARYERYYNPNIPTSQYLFSNFFLHFFKILGAAGPQSRAGTIPESNKSSRFWS